MTMVSAGFVGGVYYTQKVEGKVPDVTKTVDGLLYVVTRKVKQLGSYIFIRIFFFCTPTQLPESHRPYELSLSSELQDFSILIESLFSVACWYDSSTSVTY